MVWALCGGVNCPSGGGRRLRPSGSAVVTVCNNYVCVCVSILPRTDLRFPNRVKHCNGQKNSSLCQCK